MGITINNEGTWNQYGDIIAEKETKISGLSQEERESLLSIVNESGVSRDDIDRIFQVLKDINISQNDLTTEFAKMCSDLETPRKDGAIKTIQAGVSFTSGMVTLGQAAAGIASKNPMITLPAVLEAAKSMVK